MKEIWKYEIGLNSELNLYLSKDAKIIFVGEQNNGICLWIEVSQEDMDKDCAFDDKEIPRTFYVYSTGQAISENMKYIGTAILHDGMIVYHVYEELN